MDDCRSRIDIFSLESVVQIDLGNAFLNLTAFYKDVDERNAANIRDLQLPCNAGCANCCDESVFLTPLEFLFSWAMLQTLVDETTEQTISDEFLAIYKTQQSLIASFEKPTPNNIGHTQSARRLRFRCPLLDEHGKCRVYPARELFARLFGNSFNDEPGGIYGCERVGRHLNGKTVTLVSAQGYAQKLLNLPLTYKRQVYPYYVEWLYRRSSGAVGHDAFKCALPLNLP